MLHAVIMAGGGGTRFWPRSRQARPKQFLALAGDRSLLQMACDRLDPLLPAANTWVITAAAHRDECLRQVPTLPPANVVGEPCGRDTAACIALGAALVARRDPDATMLVTPADHVIEPVREFGRAVQAACAVVDDRPDALVTFGIPPTFPSTGYGYIHRGAEVSRRNGLSVYRVEQFREKPDADTAERFVLDGGYYWNSGIFLWKAATVLAELRRNRPALAEAAERIAAAWDSPERDAVLAAVYPTLEKISIDYAVMEPAKTVFVLQAPFKWDDAGSWLALERLHPQDAAGNTVLATHAGIRTTNCVIAADAGRFVGTIGVSDLVIVQDGDCTLVAHRRDEGAVKQLVDALKARGMDHLL